MDDSKLSVLLGKCGLSCWGAPLGDSSEIRSIMNQLRNGNANGSQGEPNASAKESMGSSAVTMPFHCVCKK
ncbi:hypothetical protein CsSME_00048009 [Camellia sinensis var. sinensis]